MTRDFDFARWIPIACLDRRTGLWVARDGAGVVPDELWRFTRFDDGSGMWLRIPMRVRRCVEWRGRTYVIPAEHTVGLWPFGPRSYLEPWHGALNRVAEASGASEGRLRDFATSPSTLEQARFHRLVLECLGPAVFEHTVVSLEPSTLESVWPGLDARLAAQSSPAPELSPAEELPQAVPDAG